ncbi:unnamed protein product [Heterosigma akashiwo]
MEKIYNDRLIGVIAVISLVCSFIYYSLWVILLPFAEEGHPVHDYFPAKEYAISVPLALMSVLFCSVLMYLGIVIVQSSKAEEQIVQATTIRTNTDKKKS